MNNIFKNAYFGKTYRTRNGGIAFYCRFDDEGQKHCLMVNDKENDFILCMENGHVFDINKLDKPIVGGKHNGKTAIEIYGWNKEELSNFRLDIVSEWQEEIIEEELYKHRNKYLAIQCDWHYPEGLTMHEQSLIKNAYEAGYRKANEKR